MFEVGKKVICVKSADNGVGYAVKRGQIFNLYGIRTGCHIPVLLDIGMVSKEGGSRCGTCNKVRMDDIMWVDARLFAPYDDSLSELTTEHILNEQTVEP